MFVKKTPIVTAIFLFYLSACLTTLMSQAMDMPMSISEHMDPQTVAALSNQLFDLVQMYILGEVKDRIPFDTLKEKITDLVKRGADLNPTNFDENPLVIALSLGSSPRLPLIRLLLELGSNVNIVSNSPNKRPLIFSLMRFYDDLEELYSLYELLHAGANINATDVNGNTYIDHLIKMKLFSFENAEAALRLALLYGGITKNTRDTGVLYRHIQSILGGSEEWPAYLLKAVINRDIDFVKELLAHGYGQQVTRDSYGTSALAYAAGQGNEAILSLLFKHEAYQYDTVGIEEAIDIVASRLRGLDPKSQEYKTYQYILKGLGDQLNYARRQQADLLAKGIGQQLSFNPDLIPEEMKHQIMYEMLGNKDIVKLISHGKS
jgi:ankyrin repeat protein